MGAQVKTYERNPQESLRQKVNKRALKRQEIKERKKMVSGHGFVLQSYQVDGHEHMVFSSKDHVFVCCFVCTTAC